MFRRVLEDAVRKEMKSRLDEVLAAGKEWNQTAKDLTNAIENLRKDIKEGKDPSSMQPVADNLKRLSGPTIKLSKAFEKYTVTLIKVSEKL